MAGESVSTEAAPTPTFNKAGGIPATGIGVGAGWDPTAIDALTKLNFAYENKLAADKETLTEKTSTYNQALENQGRTEGTGFKALRSRNFASGLMNSGFALGNRQELAGRYTGQRAAKGERQQFGLNRLKALVERQEGEARKSAGEIGNANTARAETARRKQELEAAQGAKGAGTPGGAYPGANAAIAATGLTPQQKNEYVKNNSKYVTNPFNYPLVNRAGGVAQRAKGGAVTPGHAYLVGEQGPELVVPKVGGRVVPNNRLAAIRKASRGRRY